MFGKLLGGVVDSLNDTLDEASPGAGDGGSLTANLLNDKGVLDDAATNLDEGDATGLVTDTHTNVFAKGGVINDLGDGDGSGLEGGLSELDATVNDAVATPEAVDAAVNDATDGAFEEAQGARGDAVETLEGAASGSSDGGTLTNNLLDDRGVADDAINNLDEGDASGLIVDTHTNLFAPGGVINDLAEGDGSGLEGGLSETDASVDNAVSTPEELDTAVNDATDGTFEGAQGLREDGVETLEGAAAGSSDGGTLTNNLLDDKGVADDAIANLDEGDATSLVTDTHTNVFAPGGLINDLADGDGSGLEGALDGLDG